MIRKPAVSGQFYPDTNKSLTEEIASLITVVKAQENAIAAVSPHAGYIYSGSVAANVFASIKPKSTYIIMGPNHTGLGEPFSISMDESWETPLGKVRLNKALALEIKKNSEYIKEDELAHLYEHSIEVQLPFLQYLQKDFKLVPIIISHADITVYQKIARSIVNAIKGLKLEKDIAIIASSDMTHYEPHKIAEKKDLAAINAILALDEAKLIEVVGRDNITMCGYAPIAIMLAAAKELGAKKARLVKYQTSGDTSGDYSSVVGYAGILIS